MQYDSSIANRIAGHRAPAQYCAQDQQIKQSEPEPGLRVNDSGIVISAARKGEGEPIATDSPEKSFGWGYSPAEMRKPKSQRNRQQQEHLQHETFHAFRNADFRKPAGDRHAVIG